MCAIHAATLLPALEYVCLCRRLTVPLSGAGEATLSKLMKDDDAYTFSELPRINPHYKVSTSGLPLTAAETAVTSAQGGTYTDPPSHLSCDLHHA